MSEIDFDQMVADHRADDRHLREQIDKTKAGIPKIIYSQTHSDDGSRALPLENHPFVVPTPEPRTPPIHGGEYNDLALARIELRKHGVGGGGFAAHDYYTEFGLLLYDMDEAMENNPGRAKQIWEILSPALMDEISTHKYDALFFDPYTTHHRRCDVHIRPTTKKETEHGEWPYLRQPHSGCKDEPGYA